MPRPKRKPGAPKGNQNARKHGFYSKVLSEADQLELQTALGISGIDEEIALLRVKIQTLLSENPDDVQLILDATNTIARLLRTKFNLDKKEARGIREAITSVIRDLALPVGIGAAIVSSK